MESYQDVLVDLREPTRSLRHAIPATWSGFLALHQSAMAEGVVPTKLKEVIAMAIAAVQHCDGCIAYHAKAAAQAGASREEVAEILGVALLMDGGPGSVYAPKTWHAFLEFKNQVDTPT